LKSSEEVMQDRVRRSIVRSSALGILIIGVIVALVSILPLYSRLRSSQENSLIHAVTVRTMAVEEYLSRARDITLQITSRTQIRKKLENFNQGSISLAELRDFSGDKLVDAMKLSDEVVGITRLSTKGKPLVHIGLPLSTRYPWPIPPRDSREVQIHGPCLINGKYYFLVGAHIFSDGAVVVGTDIVLFKIDRLRRIVEDYTGLGKTGETMLGLMDGDHVHIFSPTRTKKDYAVDNVPGDSPAGVAITRAANKNSGVATVADPSGKNVIIAYGPIYGSDWGIGVKMDARELYSPVNRQTVLIIVIILALILLGSYGIVLLIRPLTKELQKEHAGRRQAEEQKEKLELQLLQSQKLESVGRLAGGVAHDFNNLLSAILGYSGMALKELPADNLVWRHVKTIEEAGKKGATLIRQLLAFSRKQILRISLVNLNDIVQNLAKMLTVMIGEDVALELKTSTPVRNVMADPGQIEQVLMNLAVNARDAMPCGGRIIIETADVDLDADYARRHEGVTPGSYVLLSVTDTGEGMAKDVQEKIFEPFFTTKEIGKGTGLGLATVYGIIKQHNGHVWFYSEPDKGTTFKIYLPTAQGEAGRPLVEMPAVVFRGVETILVVDDEPSIRMLVKDILEPLGYRTLDASCGKEALQTIQTAVGQIDLLLTDVILPGMNGRELAREFAAKKPGGKVLFMSGYSDSIIASHGILEAGTDFIEKPLTRDALLRKIRKMLDGK
jgi:signal transduction histidine kinase/CheY-like chemotaxis protein